jgi:hypothetical protein
MSAGPVVDDSHIYFASWGDCTIFMANLEGTNVTTLIWDQPGVGGPVLSPH